MGWAEKAWDAFRDVLRLQDKVQVLSSKAISNKPNSNRSTSRWPNSKWPSPFSWAKLA